MTTPIDIRELEQRPRRYWNIDGIPELVLGGVWTLWGTALLAGEALPRGGAWRLYWFLVPAVLVLSGFAANWLTKRLKERLTYPRTGYVELPDPGVRPRAVAAVVAIAAAALVAALVVKGDHPGVERTTPVVVGVLASLAFLVASVRQRAPHLLALAGVAMMLGLAFSVLGAGIDGQHWLLVGLGLASAALGGWRLSRYLRSHPIESVR